MHDWLPAAQRKVPASAELVFTPLAETNPSRPGCPPFRIGIYSNGSCECKALLKGHAASQVTRMLESSRAPDKPYKSRASRQRAKPKTSNGRDDQAHTSTQANHRRFLPAYLLYLPQPYSSNASHSSVIPPSSRCKICTKPLLHDAAA